MTMVKPFQLLEINVISAQDLQPVSKNMRTYATAWVHPERKLTTRVDKQGHNTPTWNDKFVFRVDDDFLRADTSAVMIEIYALHWFRDSLVGTVRVLVGNLIPPPTRRNHHHHHHHIGMRFVALQVRRPSGRPQGILNIGVTLLDSSMRSMPLYTQLSASAVGFPDLMGSEDPHNLSHHNDNKNNNNGVTNVPCHVKPILRRSRSERSERTFIEDLSGSTVCIPLKVGPVNPTSMISGSELTDSQKGKKGKANSVISGAELRERPKENGKKGKANSVISGSELKAQPIKNDRPTDPTKDKLSQPPPTADKSPNEKAVLAKPPAIGKPISKGSIVNGKFIFGGPGKANSIWSDSEVGPSPSEVAAAMAVEKYPLSDNGSSVLDGWSLDESVEGLRSKLERWRTELPPLYDRGFSTTTTAKSTNHHLRRHTDGGSGLFSCFGNVYGYECQCICGKPSGERRNINGRVQSSSGSPARSFL